MSLMKKSRLFVLAVFAAAVSLSLSAADETTIAAWVKLDALPTADKSVGVRKLWTSDDASRELELVYNSANGAPYLQLWARLRTQGKLFAVYQRDILDLCPGDWHHYCVTYSCKDQVMKLYIDGFFIGKRMKDYEGKSALLPLGEGAVRPGNVPQEGLVCLDRALTAGEAKALAAKGKPAAEHVRTKGFRWGVVDPTDEKSWFLPSFTVPESAARAIAVVAAKGEYEPASVIVRSERAVKGLVPAVEPFVCGDATLPASVADIRVVKCVPTMATYPKEQGSRILKPIMLMHDDDLLRVDVVNRTAELKLRTKDGVRHVPMSDFPGEAFIDAKVKAYQWLMQRYGTDAWPVFDTPVIQPLDLPAEELKQYWITLKVPDGAKPGDYRSTLAFRDAQGWTLARVPFGLTVLPFALPEPKAKHDPAKPFRRLLYTRHKCVDFAPDAVGSITSNGRSEAQFRADMRNIREHGIESTTIMMDLMLPRWLWNRWGQHDDPTAGRIETRTKRVNTAYAKKVLKVLAEENQLSHPHYVNNGCNFGFREGYTAANLPVLTQLITETKALFREATGWDDLCVYAVDEAKGDAITRQYAAWEELHRQGIRIYATCLPKNVGVVATGKVDTVVQSVKPTKANAAMVHAYGGEILSYAYPQSGQKDEVHSYRLGYGFMNWLNDYDGFSLYCWDEISGHPWNEFECWGGKSYVYVFQTSDGVVDTPSWEGQREAVDDVRYATLLRSLKDPEADAWLDTLDPSAPDFSPSATRKEIVRRLLTHKSN